MTLILHFLTSHPLKWTLIQAKSLTSDPYNRGALKRRKSVLIVVWIFNSHRFKDEFFKGFFQFQLKLEDDERNVLRVPLQNQCHPPPSTASSETALGVIRKTFDIRVSSGGKKWVVRRSLEDFRFLDKQLHLCVYDRKFSDLSEIPDQENINSFNASSNQVRNPL